MSVYKPCDIRGTIDHLSVEQYRSWGRCIARRAKKRTVYIGGDVRKHTPDFLAALEAGLVDGGAIVRNLGIVPTPMVYFANRNFGTGNCAIVTASHNPPHYNGLKWMIEHRPPTHEQVEQFRAETERNARDDVEPGERADTEIEPQYVSWLATRFGRPLKKFHLVVDPGSGCWSTRASRALGHVLPGVKITAMHDEPDGDFPMRDPDCAKPQNLGALCETVKNLNANLGLAFDGDGDRVAFVDDDGVALTAEQATCVLLQSFAGKLDEKPFVYDVKFSDKVAEAAASHGAQPHAERSGHAFIRAAMQRTGAPFGAEISGHFFYGELDGSDDGLFTAMLMIDHLIKTGTTLSDLRAQCPDIHMTGDLRLTLDADQCAAGVARARKAFPDRPISTIDGVRIDFDDGWALVRTSVTEPALTFRFEGRDAAALDAVVNRFCDAMGDIGEALRKKHHA